MLEKGLGCTGGLLGVLASTIKERDEYEAIHCKLGVNAHSLTTIAPSCLHDPDNTSNDGNVDLAPPHELVDPTLIIHYDQATLLFCNCNDIV